MKVKAEGWIKVDGTWHRPGEMYEVPDEKPSAVETEPVQETQKAVTRRGRRKVEE